MSVKVLVTGGSGFIGSWCIVRLLQDPAKYHVHTTVRSLKREAEVRAMLAEGGIPDGGGNRVSFFAADLNADAGWDEAVAGCEYVLHVASPFPLGVPKNEDDLIVPAREGALRVLRAARNSKTVKRVVLTSSVAAVAYGHAKTDVPYNEASWTDVAKPIPPYHKSKTLAERAAWDFIEKEGNGLELATVNPVGVFGPVLGKDFSSSVEIVKKILNRELPMLPRFYIAGVDVRDTADLHILAMTHPDAKGQRFLASVGEPLSAKDFAVMIKRRCGSKYRVANRVPTTEMPTWLARALSVLISDLRLISDELDNPRRVDASKATRVLGWKPMSVEESVEASVATLVKLKVV